MAGMLDDLTSKIDNTYRDFQALIRRMEEHEGARVGMSRASTELRGQAEATKELTGSLREIVAELREVVTVLRRSDPDQIQREVKRLSSRVEELKSQGESQAATLVTRIGEVSRQADSHASALREYSQGTNGLVGEAGKEAGKHKDELATMITGLQGELESTRDAVGSQAKAVEAYKQDTSASIEQVKDVMAERSEVSIVKHLAVLIAALQVVSWFF